MAHGGHFSEGYFGLLRAIKNNGGVECENTPELFFPEDIPDAELRIKAIRAAKEICKRCPVLDICREYALESGEQFGIWAATSPAERI
jgi:WhiB family redox-sensing transcriptional regulator